MAFAPLVARRLPTSAALNLARVNSSSRFASTSSPLKASASPSSLLSASALRVRLTSGSQVHEVVDGLAVKLRVQGGSTGRARTVGRLDISLLRFARLGSLIPSPLAFRRVCQSFSRSDVASAIQSTKAQVAGNQVRRLYRSTRRRLKRLVELNLVLLLPSCLRPLFPPGSLCPTRVRRRGLQLPQHLCSGRQGQPEGMYTRMTIPFLFFPFRLSSLARTDLSLLVHVWFTGPRRAPQGNPHQLGCRLQAQPDRSLRSFSSSLYVSFLSLPLRELIIDLFLPFHLRHSLHHLRRPFFSYIAIRSLLRSHSCRPRCSFNAFDLAGSLPPSDVLSLRPFPDSE